MAPPRRSRISASNAAEARIAIAMLGNVVLCFILILIDIRYSADIVREHKANKAAIFQLCVAVLSPFIVILAILLGVLFNHLLKGDKGAMVLSSIVSLAWISLIGLWTAAAV
ncbi:MAG: hypothetical protein M1813_000732 [Trichoglossum hirsutum]|nr:MAG: hypothetical protein M1813_000732 [Trichoglossum hirsutum]